jgi:hypothetical protein
LKSISERLRRIQQLPLRERIILAQAWGLFILAELALLLLPFRRVLALSDRAFLPRRHEPAEVPTPSAARLAWLVEVAGRYTPVTVTCLKKALVLSWLLGRRGIAARLRIGVARQHGALAAHAWLERKGQVIGEEPAAQGYEPLWPAA